MKKTYNVKYKLPNGWLWKSIKNVIGDGMEPENGFRFFHLENDTIIHLPIYTAVIFGPERQKVIEKEMSKEIGQPIQRN